MLERNFGVAIVICHREFSKRRRLRAQTKENRFGVERFRETVIRIRKMHVDERLVRSLVVELRKPRSQLFLESRAS
jgi:hypothetical protein